eukprot:TRINITY_DN12938_c0_g3_i1.p1 TRINITY_DN12938_c0_g3~~TRINITY_DN12938_c0_g3_i1.p1  ORF type:complete len:1254 (-),score=164.63 TRINITY_DN12938_c0_g3_i1:110-3838(-)
MASSTAWWKLLAVGLVLAGADKSDKAISLPDLGRRFKLGDFYDAASDELVGGRLWPIPVYNNPDYVDEQPAESSNYKFAYSDSSEDKMELFDLSGEMAFSFSAAVTVEVSGSAKYLSNTARSSSAVRSSLMYQLRTKKKSINLHDPAVRNQMIPIENIPPQATHVVSSIIYGGNLVATYEQLASNAEEMSQIQGSLEGKIKLTIIDISAKVDLNMESENRVTSKDTNLYIFGDILPGVKDDGTVTEVPLDPEAVVDFMASAHIKTVETGGVPCWITLTPIKWLITGLDRLVHELSNDIISQAADTRAELEQGLRILNDLIAEDDRGFLAWKWKVEAYRTAFNVFEMEYKTNLSAGLISYRRGDSDISAISAPLDNFRNSEFTLALVRKFSESQMDILVSLREMVSSIEEEGGVQMAKRFYDYMAKTFTSSYDTVVALVLAGMTPGKDRSSMTALRRFYAFAKRNKRSDEAGLVTHCSQSVKDPSVGLTCKDHYKLIIIHFDSFCTQFCSPQYCGAEIRSCEDPDASALLDPTDDKEAWCQNPCTRVVAHFKQGPARKADSLLPDVLEAPTIATLIDDAVELEPHNQKVILQIQPPEGDVGILHWRVRITHYVFDDVTETWLPYESIVETRTAAENVTLKGLTAGEKYIFEVAGVNGADAGPYSEIYGHRSGVQIAHILVAIDSATLIADTSSSGEQMCGESPFQAQSADPTKDSAPNWMPWDVNMAVSALGPNQFRPSFVTFHDGEQKMFCSKFTSDASDKRKFSCSIPCNSMNETKTYSVKVWDDSLTTVIAESTLSHVRPSGYACNLYQRGSVFCDVSQRLPQWGCVARGVNVSTGQGDIRCANCMDEDNNPTYYGSNTCSQNKCLVGEKWCNKKGSDECISDACNSDACDPESVEVAAGTGGAKLCALPCRFAVPSSMHLLLDGQPVTKLLHNEDGLITCADGYSAVGSRSSWTYSCVNNVQEDVYDLSDANYAGGLACEANQCTCANGVAASGIECPENKAEVCKSCNAGYHWNTGGSACEVNICTCAEGYAASGPECPEHDTALCAACFTGLTLKDGVCQVSLDGHWRGSGDVKGFIRWTVSGNRVSDPTINWQGTITISATSASTGTLAIIPSGYGGGQATYTGTQIVFANGGVYVPTEADVYKKGTCMPSGSYTVNECCPEGHEQTGSIDECQAAYIVLRTSSLSGTTWGGEAPRDSRPPGCFLHTPNKNVHYNPTNPSQAMTGDDEVICKKVEV